MWGCCNDTGVVNPGDVEVSHEPGVREYEDLLTLQLWKIRGTETIV